MAYRGNKGTTKHSDFISALNESAICFNNDKKVMIKLRSFHTLVISKQGTTQERFDEALYDLIVSMMDSAKLDHKYFDKFFITNPFT